MFGKISVCSMAILLPILGILGQSTFGSIVSVVKDPGERNNHRDADHSHRPGRLRTADCKRGQQRRKSLESEVRYQLSVPARDGEDPARILILRIVLAPASGC